MAETWLTVKQAAPAFGGGIMRVYRRIWSGELPAVDISPRNPKPNAKRKPKPDYRIAESALDEYFRSRTIVHPEVRTA